MAMKYIYMSLSSPCKIKHIDIVGNGEIGAFIRKISLFAMVGN